MTGMTQGKLGSGELVYQRDVLVFVVFDELVDCGSRLAPNVCNDIEGHGWLTGCYRKYGIE
jgi:hypothetical protein